MNISTEKHDIEIDNLAFFNDVAITKKSNKKCPRWYFIAVYITVLLNLLFIALIFCLFVNLAFLFQFQEITNFFDKPQLQLLIDNIITLINVTCQDLNC